MGKFGKTALALLAALVVVPAAVYFLFPGFLYDLSIQRYRDRAGLTEHRVQVGDHVIAYLEGGTGEPIVLLHGFGADKDHWTQFAEFLTDSYRIIAPDLPGFGESSKRPDTPYTIAAQVRRLDDFAAALGLERFHLAGNSMGGAIAGKYAVDHPDRLLSLGLFAPGDVLSAEKSEHMKLVEQGTNMLLVESPGDFQRLLAFLFVDVPPIPRSILRYLGQKSVEQHDFNAGIYRQLMVEEAYALDEEAGRIAVPTLVLWCDHDRVLDVSGARVLAESIPRNTTVILKDCGHIPMVERPAETAAHHRAFLESTRTPEP